MSSSGNTFAGPSVTTLQLPSTEFKVDYGLLASCCQRILVICEFLLHKRRPESTVFALSYGYDKALIYVAITKYFESGAQRVCSASRQP